MTSSWKFLILNILMVAFAQQGLADDFLKLKRQNAEKYLLKYSLKNFFGKRFKLTKNNGDCASSIELKTRENNKVVAVFLEADAQHPSSSIDDLPYFERFNEIPPSVFNKDTSETFDTSTNVLIQADDDQHVIFDRLDSWTTGASGYDDSSQPYQSISRWILETHRNSQMEIKKTMLQSGETQAALIYDCVYQSE